jgi:GGDEF domain-containing protein
MFNKRKMLEDSLEQQYMLKSGYLLLLGLDRLSMSYSEHGREYMENILVECARNLEEMALEDIIVYHAEEGVFAVCFLEYTRKEVTSFYEEITRFCLQLDS